MAFKYDGSETDRDHAIESFYEWSAWELAEDLYDARRIARELLALLAKWTPSVVVHVEDFPDWLIR